MRAVPAVAAAQFGVFTAAQAIRAGWTSHALRHAVKTGQLERLRPGVYAVTKQPTGNRYVDAAGRLRHEAVAMSLANRRVPVSHGSAAALHGLSLVQVPDRVRATYPRGFRGEIANVHVHSARLFPGHVVRLNRILLLSAARTVVDIGRDSGTDDAVAAADSALRNGLATPAQLEEALERSSGWPGVAAARRAVTLADPNAESVLESLSRLRIADACLPAPAPQVTIRDCAGRYCGRPDFYWDEFGVVGEADGLGKYDGKPLSLREEKIRQGLLEDEGLIVVRWGWDDLDPFAPTAARLTAAFARGLRANRAPRRWRPQPPPGWYRPRAVS